MAVSRYRRVLFALGVGAAASAVGTAASAVSAFAGVQSLLPSPYVEHNVGNSMVQIMVGNAGFGPLQVRKVHWISHGTPIACAKDILPHNPKWTVTSDVLTVVEHGKALPCLTVQLQRPESMPEVQDELKQANVALELKYLLMPGLPFTAVKTFTLPWASPPVDDRHNR